MSQDEANIAVLMASMDGALFVLLKMEEDSEATFPLCKSGCGNGCSFFCLVSSFAVMETNKNQEEQGKMHNDNEIKIAFKYSENGVFKENKNQLGRIPTNKKMDNGKDTTLKPVLKRKSNLSTDIRSVTLH